jgi:GNAT superfamily N-acetyltransferase
VDLSLRAATAADRSALAGIFRAASLSNDGDRDNLLAHPEMLEFDAACIETSDVRVASVGDQLVGFATSRLTSETTAELDDLFVDPAWMRRGVARAFIAEIGVSLREAGVTRLDVTANHHALPFYESVGFVTEGAADTRFGLTPRMSIQLVAAR